MQVAMKDAKKQELLSLAKEIQSTNLYSEHSRRVLSALCKTDAGGCS